MWRIDIHSMMKNMAPDYMWCWAMFKATQDLNFNYDLKIDTSPYHFVTGQHIDMKYLHSFFAECYGDVSIFEL